MDARRRSTMQPIDPNIRGTGIPMPSTVKKPAPSGRMSLAGPAIRAPYPIPPSTNPRQSMYRSQNSNPLLQSTSKANPYGKTPLSNSAARRDSLWHRGPAAAAPPTSQVAKDPRPLRDKAFQQKERQDILEYLKGAGLDITMQRLANIQSKDYRAIFEFLVQCLDPAQAIDPSNGKFEEGFINALKALRYPYVHQIDSKWLAAPASLHTWPMLLGVLHWLVELCKMRDFYMSSGHPTLQDSENIPEEFEDEIDHRALGFDYCEQSYVAWLNGADDFIEPQRIIEDRYEKKNQRVQQDLETKSRQYHEANTEYKKLKSSAAPVAELEAVHAGLLSDRVKFENVLKQIENKSKKLTEHIAYAESDLKQREEDLCKLQAEHDRLTGIVKEQNLSPEEATRMTTDYDTLSRNLEDLKQKLADSQKNVLSLEVNLSNRVGAAEEIVDLYMGLLSTLNLLPPLAPPLPDVDLTLELNTATSNLQQLLTGADIRKIIKPTLSNIAESKRSERASVENERLRVDNDLDQLSVECENVDSEIAVVEKKVLAINEQAENLHNAAQQDALGASQQAERLERDLAHARTAALANGMGVKSRLQTLQFQYKEQVEKVNRLKEETIRAIIKNSHDIAVFKGEVSQYLRELRECAESG